MSLHTILLGLTFSTLLARAASSAPACAPARLGPELVHQPEAWRRAVEALVASTATPGQPWSCVGGEIDLVLGEQGATLTVVSADGQVITREVASPDEIEPLGEALLAKPLPAPPEVEEAPPAPPAAEVEKAPPAPRKEAEVPSPPREPRALVSALVGPRYAGTANLVWGGFTLAAALPPRAWSGGVWLRYDALSAPLGERTPPMRELCVGASALRAFGLGPVELRAAIRPSLAVVTREPARESGNQMTEPKSPETGDGDEAGFDFRLGAAAELVVPITGVMRAVFALDGELSPIELAREPHASRAEEAPLPRYTLGLGVGVEVAIP